MKRIILIAGGIGLLWWWYRQSSNTSQPKAADGASAASLADVAKFIGDIKPAGTLSDLTDQFQQFLGISGKADAALGDPGLKTVYVTAQTPAQALRCNILGSNKPCPFVEP